MLCWSQYFPDKGLVHVVCLDQYEYNAYLEFLYNECMKQEDDKVVETTLMRIKTAKEKKEPIIFNKKNPWDAKILEKYKISEDLGFIGTDRFMQKYEITKVQYKKALDKSMAEAANVCPETLDDLLGTPKQDPMSPKSKVQPKTQPVQPVQPKTDLQQLETEMAQAIKKEEYLKAAAIRDKIKQLKEKI